MAWVRNKYFLWAASGVLLGVGFLHSYLWVSGVIGGLLFLTLLTQSKDVKANMLGAWLAWSIKSGFAVWWFWSTYPIEWLPLELGSVQLLLIFMYWSTVSVWLGMGGLLVGWLYTVISQKIVPTMKRGVMLLVFPLVWVAGELIGSLMFSLFLFGPGGSVNTAFSFGYSGYLLAQYELLLPVAKVAGVYGLSFLFALLVASLGLLFKIKKQHAVLFVIALLGVMYGTSFQEIPTGSLNGTTSYDVVIINTQFSSQLLKSPAGSKEKQESLREAVSVALEQEADYILLPEDTRFFSTEYSAEAAKSLFRLQYDNPSVVLVDSGRTENESGAVLQTYIYNNDSVVERVHKRYLVPQGEFIPTIYEKFLSLFGFRTALDQVSEAIDYRVGTDTYQGDMAENVPSVLFCFESVDPQGVFKLRQERKNAPFVAHVVSHAWFHQPESLWYQLDTMLKVQAVWNQQYIVSAGNKVTGKVYTPKGAIVLPELIEAGSGWEVRRIQIPQ